MSAFWIRQWGRDRAGYASRPGLHARRMIVGVLPPETKPARKEDSPPGSHANSNFRAGKTADTAVRPPFSVAGGRRAVGADGVSCVCLPPERVQTLGCAKGAGCACCPRQHTEFTEEYPGAFRGFCAGSISVSGTRGLGWAGRSAGGEGRRGARYDPPRAERAAHPGSPSRCWKLRGAFPRVPCLPWAKRFGPLRSAGGLRVSVAGFAQ